MNISQEIQQAARGRGLDMIQTGGGCDYVYKPFPADGFDLVLDTPEMGQSPDTLTEPAVVAVNRRDEEWTSVVELRFGCTLEALRFMSDCTGVGEFKI